MGGERQNKYIKNVLCSNDECDGNTRSITHLVNLPYCDVLCTLRQNPEQFHFFWKFRMFFETRVECVFFPCDQILSKEPYFSIGDLHATKPVK